MTNVSIAIPVELTQQQETLTAQLEAIAVEQNKLAEQKQELEISLKRIETAISYLRGEITPQAPATAGRKPMSEQARANIREGLRKAAEAKKAAAQIAVTAPTPTAPAIPPAVSKPVKKQAKS